MRVSKNVGYDVGNIRKLYDMHKRKNENMTILTKK